MPTVMMLLAALFVTIGAQDPAKPAFPKKSGIFAMTPQGPVELKISGEPNRIEKTNGVRCFYSPKDYDKIPVVEAIDSFYVSAMGWEARDVYIIVGRELLSNPSDKYQRLRGRSVTRGAVAFQVIPDELSIPGFVDQVARKLSSDPEAEIYVVLELHSTGGMTDRSYPVKVQRPAK
jgi:hypothetical protein